MQQHGRVVEKSRQARKVVWFIITSPITISHLLNILEYHLIQNDKTRVTIQNEVSPNSCPILQTDRLLSLPRLFLTSTKNLLF